VGKILTDSDLTDSIAVVVGTRPGIIKLSPVIRALEALKIDNFVAHSGQHYSYNMDKQFFIDLELPQPKYHKEEVKETELHGAQTAAMLKGLEETFIEFRPKVVVVGGDANTNLAGALAARKLGIKVAHVEAGLRSNDWNMPEEHNRIMIDHISEYLFAPTEHAKRNLIEDNVKGNIVVTGNTIVDAVYQNLKISQRKSNILNDLKLRSGEYLLVSTHREENVDSKKILTDILTGLEKVILRLKKEIIFPIHPRTLKNLREFSLANKAYTIDGLRIIDPLGYLDFLVLLANAQLVLTDSGGIQEESCILQIPCVTLRNNTERPETIEVGANIIAGTAPDSIIHSVEDALTWKRSWENPFGDGNAGKRIVERLRQI
jgi:UDP-N-acetylglucosamine 2-epimerase (non-hydrolysing)